MKNKLNWIMIAITATIVLFGCESRSSKHLSQLKESGLNYSYPATTAGVISKQLDNWKLSGTTLVITKDSILYVYISPRLSLAYLFSSKISMK